MAPKPIVIKITGDADSLEREIASARKALDKLEDSVDKQSNASKRFGAAWGEVGDKLRDVASDFTSRLGPASGAADRAVGGLIDRIGAMGPAATAALGGVAVLGAGLAKVAFDGVTAFADLGEQVHKFSLATGLSAEQSSVLVDAFDDLGIGADTGQAALVRLSKSATTNKDALHDLGVEVAYNHDGSLDLWGTLGNVAEAMSTSGDQAKTAAIGNAAFGKSWATLMPLLEGGRDGLAGAASEAEKLGIVLSGKDADAAHEFKQSLVGLNDSLDGLKLQVGRELVPGLTALVGGLTGVAGKANEAGEKGGFLNSVFKALTTTGPGMIAMFAEKADAQDKDAESAHEAAKASTDWADATEEQVTAGTDAAAAADLLRAATDRTTDAIRRAEEADRARKQAQDDLTDAVVASADVELNYERAERNTIKALEDHAQKEADLGAALDQHGVDSIEAKGASDALKDSTLQVKDAILAQANQAVATAQHNAELGGSSLDAGGKALVQRDFLSQLAQTLAPGSELRTWLDNYIGQLDTIPAAKKTTVTIEKHYVDVGGVVDTGGVALASGGPLKRGQLALVGEEGPELVVPTADSMVLPAGQTKGLLSGSGASGPSEVGVGGGGVVINISGVVGDKDAVIRWVHEGLRSYDTARRGT